MPSFKSIGMLYSAAYNLHQIKKLAIYTNTSFRKILYQCVQPSKRYALVVAGNKQHVEGNKLLVAGNKLLVARNLLLRNMLRWCKRGFNVNRRKFGAYWQI